MVKAIAAPTPELLEMVKKAEPPVRFPRGYFDPLVMATRMLLDNRLTIGQAADFYIERGVMEKDAKAPFIKAMGGRISRLRRAAITSGVPISWRACMFYDSTHLVQDTERKALCGAASNAWTEERAETNRCPRCIGVSRKLGIDPI